MNRTENFDIIVCGGGVIGLALARELYKKGARRIAVLERAPAAGKESSYAAAGMLAPHAECDRADDFFYFCNESRALYPNFALQLLEETGVDVELDRSGTVYLAFTESDSREIRERYEWQKRSAFPVEYLTGNDARRIEPFVSPDVRDGLFFPDDWQVENRKLLGALEKFAELNGIEIRASVEAANLRREKGAALTIETSAGNFSAAKIVLATGAWTSLVKAPPDAFEMPQVKPVRGQIISFRTAKRLFTRVIYSPRGYLVPRADGRILAGATVEDVGFDKSLTAGGIESLRHNAFEIAPNLASLDVREKWAGLRPASADGLPIVGALGENLFVATAHYRNGILLAPLTAKILSGKILENADSKYLDVFSPRRFEPKADAGF